MTAYFGAFLNYRKTQFGREFREIENDFVVWENNDFRVKIREEETYPLFAAIEDQGHYLQLKKVFIR